MVETRQVREMVDDIKLAAASAAVVRMRVNRVRQAARQRCARCICILPNAFPGIACLADFLTVPLSVLFAWTSGI